MCLDTITYINIKKRCGVEATATYLHNTDKRECASQEAMSHPAIKGTREDICVSCVRCLLFTPAPSKANFEASASDHVVSKPASLQSRMLRADSLAIRRHQNCLSHVTSTKVPSFRCKASPHTSRTKLLKGLLISQKSSSCFRDNFDISPHTWVLLAGTANSHPWLHMCPPCCSNNTLATRSPFSP